ncbi:MAG: HU family DNA-binding protein [Myxococcota bacterium]
MNWSTLIDAVAERSGVSRKDAHAALTAAVDIITEQLVSGASVRLHRLGTMTSRWQAPRILRKINDQQKIRLDGRYTPAFRPASRLREALANRTPQRWRDPHHQAAWQLSEALLGDLELYHEAQVPRSLVTNSTDEDVVKTCQVAFGPTWSQVVRTFEAQTPKAIRDSRNYLAAVARERWASPPT